MSASSWDPVELAPIVAGVQAGEIVGPVPSLMPRTDGACLLYPGEVHSLSGEPESGKGWITLGAVASCLLSGDDALYLDFEDAPASIVTRLLALGAPAEAIVGHLTYLRPSDPFTPKALATVLDARTYQLAVIDGVSEAFALLGLDPYVNPDAVKFLTLLPRPIAERGAAVLEVDHVIKNRETRGRYAIGAQAKLAGIAAAYSTEVLKTPSRTDDGLIKVKVEKDRHGHVRSHAEGHIIALAHIEPSDGGASVTVRLEPPDATGEAGNFRPTVLMGRVAEYLTGNPGATRNAIIRAVSGKQSAVDEAIKVLITEGYVERRQEGQKYLHHTLETFNRDTESQPSPNRVRKQLAATESPSPSPFRGDSRGIGANGHVDQATESLAAELDNPADVERAERELSRLQGVGDE